MLTKLQYGPQSPGCDAIHAMKYREKGESFRDTCTRIAARLNDTEEHFASLRDILLDMRFLPAGRIQAATGSTRNIASHNCFVSGTIEDSFVRGSGSIMARATEAATTMRMGGGIGYDFSTLRPRGALIKKLNSKSSGPVSFMQIFDAVCRATSSSGHRRGAQMGVLRVDHPDVEEFVRSKQNATELTGFNISIAVTDAFMEAVEEDKSFTLKWNGIPHRDIHARDLWETIMRSTYDWGEPGVLFIDRINEMNNLNYCEKIAATNPCGEQPLPPYGACLLGSFNLVKYLTRDGYDRPFKFNWAQFFFDVGSVVRAMDNVIDAAIYPMHEQETEALSKRRMGLGVTGVANCIEALGYPYGSPEFLDHLRALLRGLRDSAYRHSALLAAEKGSFPAYNGLHYLEGEFVQTLGDDAFAAIQENGIRNSHLLSIAPTGTISLAADNISSGIEPVFAYSSTRVLMEEHGPAEYIFDDYGVKFLDVKGKTASECTVDDHLLVLETASQFVDSSVSKTCNIPTDYPWDEFKNVYMRAWKAGCKGCTTYRAGGMREAMMVANEPAEEAELVPPPAMDEALSCTVDPLTGKAECE